MPQTRGPKDPPKPVAKRVDPPSGDTPGPIVHRNNPIDPLHASPRQVLQLQHQLGNRAVQSLIQRAHTAAGRRLPGDTDQQGQANDPPLPSRRTATVQRKHANLTEVDLQPLAGKEIAERISNRVNAYNNTPTWENLGRDQATKQIPKDQETLKQTLNATGEAFPLGLEATNTEERKLALKPLTTDIYKHLAEATKRLQLIANEELAEKPLKEKYLNGLLDDKDTEYKELVSDKILPEDVPDEAVETIITLYRPGMLTKNRKMWEDEKVRRERQRSDLGGSSGWVTKLLKPQIGNDHIKAAQDLIGDTKKADELSVDVMVQIVRELRQSKNAPNEVTSFFTRQVDLRAANESTESIEKKTLEVKEKGSALRTNALSRLGGGKDTTWAALSGDIDRWWNEVKRKAHDETFETMFAANRMTVRAIAKGGASQGGKFPAQIPVGESGTTTGKADMTLERGRESIKERTKPQTWTSESESQVKQKTGLYELSASLLDHERKEIYPQLKFYSDPEAVVFTPAASPDDQQIFAAISELVGADQSKLREISSEMTRITRAQSSDMGTKYVDKSVGNTGSDIRYGESGTIIRYAGGTGKAARAHEIAAREVNALRYTEVLKDPNKVVTEVVVEYRKHASGKFPMYTEIDHKDKCFYVLDPRTWEKTGKRITNYGKEEG